MSGIVGIVNLDGAPIDRELLSRMTKFMSVRGPDRQAIWVEGDVGFGGSVFDGDICVTEDARIDGFEKGDLGDEERIVRAYERWGEECVEHLLGDRSEEHTSELQSR